MDLMMRLWLIERPERDTTWDEDYAAVIWAATEADARRFAEKNLKPNGEGWWLDPAVTVTPVDRPAEPEVVLAANKGA